MTYKYRYIRRAIYEENPMQKVNTTRRLQDMTRLFKAPYLILSLLSFFALMILCLFLMFNPHSLYIIIPMLAILIIMVILQIPREKYLYHNAARAEELSGIMHNYEQYISSVQDILQSYGINTHQKVLALKAECESTLKSRDEKFNKWNNKILDMLIGVPIGALIASIMYADSKAIPSAILVIIIIGIAIFAILQGIRLFNRYSDGYFKDKYLLDVISELDYFFIE